MANHAGETSFNAAVRVPRQRTYFSVVDYKQCVISADSR